MNKVNSKAVLRFNLRESPSLSEVIRRRLEQNLENQLTRNGELLIASDRFRDQKMNRDDCLEKLVKILTSAAFIPKARKKTRPSFSSKLRATAAKKHQSDKKKQRKLSD